MSLCRFVKRHVSSLNVHKPYVDQPVLKLCQGAEPHLVSRMYFLLIAEKRDDICLSPAICYVFHCPNFSKLTLGGFSIPASSSFMWEMVHLGPETNTFPTASEALISSGNSIMNTPRLKISLLHGEDLN